MYQNLMDVSGYKKFSHKYPQIALNHWLTQLSGGHPYLSWMLLLCAVCLQQNLGLLSNFCLCVFVQKYI